MRAPSLAAALLLASWSLACGGDAGSGDEVEARAEDVAESVAEMAESGDESSGSMEGEVTFTVDGQEHTFDHVVADETFSMSVSTSAVLAPRPGATERFRLILTSMDLDDYEYPTTLPPEDAGTSVATAGMMIGFDVTAPDGQRWTATGDLDVESFEDDVLVATFGELDLFDPDSMDPGPTLRGGRIRVAFD